MIIKKADNPRSSIASLQELLDHPLASEEVKKRIKKEIQNIQSGFRGEKDAAYLMQVEFEESPHWMVIHDLRIKHRGLVAQIDHLLINRFLDFWVCESKYFSDGVAVNEYGEFSAFYSNSKRTYGIPSPVEQNNRHILILERLLLSGVIDLPKRLGFVIRPNLRSLILISKQARIIRPKVIPEGLNSIIKVDMLRKTVNKSIDDSSSWNVAKIVSSDTIKSIAQELVKLHTPVEYDWHSRFRLAEKKSESQKKSAPTVFQQVSASVIPTEVVIPSASTSLTSGEKKAKQKLICHSCGERIPLASGRFCWFNKKRFGGNLYCIECQKQF